MYDRAEKKQADGNGRVSAGSSRAIANNGFAVARGNSRANISGRPVQRHLARHPQGIRTGWDTQQIMAGDALTVNDFLIESRTQQWFRYKRRESANEIYVISEDNGLVYLYHITNGTYRNIDTEAHAGIVAKMQEVNAGGGAQSGVHYPFNYHADYPQNWQPIYARGHADPHYFDWVNDSDWRLRVGRSASLAIQAWLAGLTIAECASSLVAIQLDAVRRTLGNAGFDQRFGSADPHAVPTLQRLRICADISQCIPVNWMSGAGTTGDGRAVLKVGAKYFFGNHSAYLTKHPEGFFQGENCVYSGNARWSGFGVVDHTTAEMYVLMRDQYNRARTEEDYRYFLTRDDFHNIPADTMAREITQGQTYTAIYQRYPNNINPHIRPGIGVPDQITVDDLLADPTAGVTSQGVKLNIRNILGI